MDAHITITPDGWRTSTSAKTGAVYVERSVSRRINPQLTRPADSPWNFEQETQDMLREPERLTPRELNFLQYCLRRRIKAIRNGRLVMLTNQQWQYWVAISYRFRPNGPSPHHS